ncbi:MAG: response regulator transcription factor [Pseudohongiella sp.]|nr:response regulator transcription factor [Pseudohongiella sp.]
MINVLLVDDQMLVRSGIAGLLALTPDIRVVGEAGNITEAARLVESLKPDVLLLDVRMPGGTGIDLLSDLQSRDQLPATILLTTFDDDEALLKGIRAGARGFLLKDISLERLAEDIRRVAVGQSVIRPVITERIIEGVQSQPSNFDSLTMPDALTARETEILQMMASGLSNREIADAFGKSEGTVKNQVSSILSKLGVRDRVRAVLRGIEIGIL